MDALAQGAPMPTRRAVLLAVLLGAVVAVPAARAADAPAAAAPQATAATEILLADGTTVVGVVESADARGVVVRPAGAEPRTLAWSSLTPAGAFAVRASKVAADDGPGRLALAELAADLGLFALARAEYEKALALGAIEAKAYERAVADAEHRAVETLVARAQKAADDGDLAGALAVLRALKMDFASALDPRRIGPMLSDLDARIRARDEDLRRAAEELERLRLDADRKKEILARTVETKRQIALGDKRADEARAIMPRGAVSGVRKSAEAADEAYVAARKELGRLRRIVRRDEPERDEVLALLTQLDRTEYRLLFDAAKFFWDARVYARAEEWAARASYVDPVDPALLELRDEIGRSRIRYRASDVTNAHPIVR